jgi:hypothetical protein
MKIPFTPQGDGRNSPWCAKTILESGYIRPVTWTGSDVRSRAGTFISGAAWTWGAYLGEACGVAFVSGPAASRATTINIMIPRQAVSATPTRF